MKLANLHLYSEMDLSFQSMWTLYDPFSNSRIIQIFKKVILIHFTPRFTQWGIG